ncbi:MAG: tRNA pseudouridine(38-40) synthase TruA, partial [Candidatus Omnitrophica bacterium]|nr:tRNA pseudouridine(38-40) synthase TruA [Candidatus Omnitrophota bacterium]
MNQQTRRVKERGFYYHVPRKLDVRLMKSESRALIGRHDFRAFTASDHQPDNKTKAKNTIRTIQRISFSQSHGFVYIDVVANGFLYKMVRNIVGTLIQIGLGRIPKG